MVHAVHRSLVALGCALATLSLAGRPAGAATTFQDVLVQPPSLTQPQRGSLAGTLSRLSFGAGDLARGTFKLPLPIDLPTERGPILAGVTPAYSPESGITEWGMGWEVDLSIKRFRPLGELDFATDDFISPWGRLAAGSDGYYPAGLTHVVRLTQTAGGWTAITTEGTRFTFNAADAVTTSRGTYMWMLSRVDTIFGDATTLAWTRNASGRPFLSAVHWGGRGTGTQYALSLDYEPVATPFVSYASGDRQVLDQRVSRITVSVDQAGSYAVRNRYALAYQASSTGPAFYLHSITKTFASGAADPPVIYDYDQGDELRASAQFASVPGLDSYVAAHGGLALRPDHASATDVEQDGLTDLETAFDQTLLHQTATGFTAEPLAPLDTANPTCRPDPSTFNKPRTLARMHGDAAAPQVVWIKTNPDAITTHVLVCDRLGAPIYDASVDGAWGLGDNTRLADLDRDRRLDIVRVSLGKAQVLRNTSSDPQTLSFAPGPVTQLTPQLTPLATWVVDVNGDGRADLMVRHASGVTVWLGTGGGAFAPTGTNYGFSTPDGPLASFASYQLSHGDFNGDGLSDVILTKGTTALLFANHGDGFVLTPVASLHAIPWTFAFPIVADLAGTGNEAAVFVTDSQAMALPLTTASTGLLRSADDGKGTVVRFGYDRIAAAPGILRRYAALASLTIESSGYDTVTYDYTYGAPVLHTAGKYLVGFAAVDKHAPFLTEHLGFLNDDDVSGVHDRGEDRDDRTPGILRFTQPSYTDTQFHGIRWLRPARIETGYHDAGNTRTISTTTEYTSYERGFCPTVTTITGPSGVLLRTATLTTVAAIPDDLHCLDSAQRLIGSHPDPALDFNYLASLDRNSLGQITRITQFGQNLAPLVLQDVGYDADHRLASIAVPGRGTSVPRYDGRGRLISFTDPTGVVTQAAAFDPITDGLTALATVRPDAATTTLFQFDGKERLQATWDDASGASQAQPLTAYTYQDATASTPGRIDTRALADAITGTTRHTVELTAADGQTMTSGAWLGDHFALGTAQIASRTTLSTQHSFVGPMTDAALTGLTSAALRGLGTPLELDRAAGFGHTIERTTTQQASVTGSVTSELVLASATLITRVHQPGGFTAESAVDAAGKLVQKTDENGVVHRYRFDALGRLVRIETPDGDHAVAFDDFGRPARITRDGLGAIAYSYDPTTGLVTRTQRIDPTGAVIDTREPRYDMIGRAVEVVLTAAQHASALQFDYDGELDATPVAGQLGRLSRVRGEGWARTTVFDPLGRVAEQHISLTGWRALTTEKTYRADGGIASDTLTIADAGGAVQLTRVSETVLDGNGRIASVKVDGQVLYTLGYDSEGRLARADFASGEAITFDYDPVTHQRRGYQIDAPAAAGGVHWERDPRGLVASETYVHDATTTQRSYTYDGRGALTRAATPSDVASYTYTASGLPDAITDQLGSRTVHRTPGIGSIGGVTYTWDAGGRVTGKGDWTFEYGASDQLAHAHRAGRDLDFAYDEAGNRLIKRVNGAPVRAELAGGVLTADHFVELVTVGDVVAGVLDNGQFVSMLTDPRGTPFAGPDGTSSLASPYGTRAAQLGYAEVLDYARLGWDPDLEVVRMGVRDYDPALGQFLSPDPLYFENLDKCQDSPLQCALYGYAGGNPVSFVDPTGLGFWNWVGGALKIAGAYGIAALSVAACTTGAGCVIGGLGLAYASSLGASGVEDIATDSTTNHQVNQAIASVTNQRTADSVDLGIAAATTGWALSRSPYFTKFLLPRPAPGPIDELARIRTLSDAELAEIRGGTRPAPTAVARELASQLPDKLFKWGQCKQAAEAMAKSFQRLGVSGEVLEIRATQPHNDFMVSDFYQSGRNSITQTGEHAAVRVGDTVFDNLNRNGVPYQAFIDSLHTAAGGVADGAITVTATPF